MATVYKFVRRPKYIHFGPRGQIEELFCKVCGSVIASMAETVTGRRMDLKTKQWIEERTREFRRTSRYAELKIEFTDGSFHVTNGCIGCLSGTLTPEQLHELHLADMELDNMIYPGQEDHMKRVALRAVAIRTDGGGIL